jgi:hypothetical protein
MEDQEEMIKSSIHSVVLISIQRKCDHYNYFNMDQIKLDKYLKLFPVFVRTNHMMQKVHEKFEKFKLDDKEYSIYTTILIISTANKYLDEYDKITKVREDLGVALRKYMNGKRLFIFLRFIL